MTARRPVDPAKRLLDRRVQDFFRELPLALTGQEEGIHEMRVAGRRLRVALPVLSSRMEGKRARRVLKALRELTRAAGQSRDLDVGLELLAGRVARDGASAEARTLVSRLRGARTRSRRRLADALLDQPISRLRHDLRRVLAHGALPEFSAFLRLRDERDLRGAAVLELLSRLGDRHDAVALHELRIAARRLRYLGEVSDALRGPSDAPAIFKKLQARLGEVHDAHVLASWLLGQAVSADRLGKTALAAEARRLAEAFEAEARGHHQALLASEPRLQIERGLEALGRARNQIA